MTRENFQSLAQDALQTRLTAEERRARQQRVYHETLRLSSVLNGPNFTRVGRDDMRRMAMLIDEYFFEGRLLPTARAEGLRFGWSSRMTRNAGKTVTTYRVAGGARKRSFEVIMSSSLLFQTFGDLDRPVVVTGLACRNRLEAMQRVLEHELVHLLEMLVWDTSSCSRRRFQGIAGRKFGHTEHRHDLITQHERASARFNIRPGQRVRFDFEGQPLEGFVNRITRRATVLVADPHGEPFTDGGRYRRYYVPLEHLRPAK